MFHGPHQREIEKRFASFGTCATPVSISKTGKNALDLHLSLCTGYIASRNPDSKMAVVASDKGQRHLQVAPPVLPCVAAMARQGLPRAADKVVHWIVGSGFHTSCG